MNLCHQQPSIFGFLPCWLLVAPWLFYFYIEYQRITSHDLVSILDGLVSVLILSAGWTIIIVEGWKMFAEAWIKKREEKGREEERQRIVKQLKEKLQTRGPITEEDLQALVESKG